MMIIVEESIIIIMVLVHRGGMAGLSKALRIGPRCAWRNACRPKGWWPNLGGRPGPQRGEHGHALKTAAADAADAAVAAVAADARQQTSK